MIYKNEQEFNERVFRDFCEKYNFTFPNDYVEYLLQFNDALLAPNCYYFQDNGFTVRFLYGTSDNDYSNIERVYEWYKKRLPVKCVPIADPDFGNQICMSLEEDSYGEIYFWDHETMDTDDGDKCILQLKDMIFLASSFSDFFRNINYISISSEEVLVYQALLDINSGGVTLKCESKVVYIDFEECAQNYAKEKNLATSKCVATRDVTKLSFTFYTNPRCSIFFKNHFFKDLFLGKSAVSEFLKLHNEINKYGYTSYDLS